MADPATPDQAAPDSARASPRSTARRDLVVIAVVTLLFFLLAARAELSERVTQWALRHEAWDLDELPLTLAVLCGGLAWFGWRRLGERSREIRARLHLEAAMQQAMQSNRELARQLLRLQEEERSRIARELHDEMAQQCVAIRVEAAGIEDEACRRELHAVAEGARVIRGTVDRLHRVVRDMLTWLRPPMLDVLGLGVSLHALAAGWSQRHGIPCSVQVDASCERLDDEVRVALYRVAQEALTNVARHAAASHVRLALGADAQAQGLLLTVDDDGRGLPAGQHAGLGLLGMAERVAGLGARLDLAASPSGGLRVAVRVPQAALQAREVPA